MLLSNITCAFIPTNRADSFRRPKTARGNTNRTPFDWAERQLTSASNSVYSTLVQSASANAPLDGTGIRQIRQQIASLLNLDADWDGDGAVRLDKEILSSAVAYLEFALAGKKHVPIPHLAPLADGGVQAEWHGENYRFEIYFEHDGEIAAWTENLTSCVEMEAEADEAIQLLVDWTTNIELDHSALG